MRKQVSSLDSLRALDNCVQFRKTDNFKDWKNGKWKMALVQNGSPKYYSDLNDNDLVQTNQFHVQTRDGVPLVHHRVWIGLGKAYSL